MFQNVFWMGEMIHFGVLCDLVACLESDIHTAHVQTDHLTCIIIGQFIFQMTL